MARYLPKLCHKRAMSCLSSPVSAVYAWNAWDHDPLLARKMVAFYDSGFPMEARVINDDRDHAGEKSTGIACIGGARYTEPSTWELENRLPFQCRSVGRGRGGPGPPNNLANSKKYILNTRVEQ